MTHQSTRFIDASLLYSGVGRAAAQLLTPSTDRLRVDATTSGSSDEAALPAGSVVLRISASAPCWIRFGNAGMDAAAADVSSMYFPGADVEYIGVPLDESGNPVSHVRVIPEGAPATHVHFERVA